MPGYWWGCEKCDTMNDFQAISSTSGIYEFIWKILLPAEWNQSLLVQECRHCNELASRITYKFPRKEELLFRVVHIVGLDPEDGYLPMMWATYAVGEPNNLKYDFKYLTKGSLYGLNRPAIFTRNDLCELFDLYRLRTGLTSFP